MPPPSAAASSSSSGRVIFTVFAGRRRFLAILMTYVRRLLTDGTLTEAHLWDYTKVAADRTYLRTLHDVAASVSVINPSDADASFPDKFKDYYAHYAALLHSELDWLIKCDDDVMFIAGLPTLLRFAREDDGKHLLYFPSIVNNDVAASFQAADGLITDPEYVVRLAPSAPEGPHSRSPVSDWYNCSACADYIHALFLSRPSAFFTGCVHEWSMAARVPINFFAIRGDDVATHFGAYAHEHYVDEPYLTALLTNRTGRPSAMVTDCVVAHLSFGFQRLANISMLTTRYRKLAHNQQQLNELARQTSKGRVWPYLSRSCATTAPKALQQGRRTLHRAPDWRTFTSKADGRLDLGLGTDGE